MIHSVLRDYPNSAAPIIRIQPLPENFILTGQRILSIVKNIFLWIFSDILKIYIILDYWYASNNLPRPKIMCKTLVKMT